MPEIAFYDPALPIAQQPACLDFTDAANVHWSGIAALPPKSVLALAPGMRHDIYILDGSLCLGHAEHASATFLSVGAARRRPMLRAGGQGALLFMYRDHWPHEGDDSVVAPAALTWHAGGAAGLRIAPLAQRHHRLMLVAWQAGARVAPHGHPAAEDILVLRGELQDQRGRYRAGTWLRLHAGEGHAPFAVSDTLILLRNGHLRMHSTSFQPQ